MSISAIASKFLMAAFSTLYMGSLNAHETQDKVVHLEPSKKVLVEVFTTAQADTDDLTCSFIGKDKVIFVTKEHVARCVIETKVTEAQSLTVRTTNNKDNYIDYRILVH